MSQICRVLKTLPFCKSEKATEIGFTENCDFIDADLLNTVCVVNIQIKAIREIQVIAGLRY